jgi:aminopeptidase N
VCWAAVWDLCRDGELPAAEYAQLVLRNVATESDHTAVRSTLQQAQTAARLYTPPAARSAVLLAWQHGLSELLAGARPGSDHQLAFAKALPVAAEDPATADRLSGWLVGRGLPEGLVVDQELRWTVVRALARLGRLDAAAIAAEANRDRTVTGAEQAAAARAARPVPEAKQEAWQQAVESEALSNSAQRAVCQSFWQRGQDAVLAPYVERYLQVAADISANRGAWASRGHARRINVLRHLFPVPADLDPFLARLDAWRGEHDLSESVRRVIEEARDDALRALRCQTASP